MGALFALAAALVLVALWTRELPPTPTLVMNRERNAGETSAGSQASPNVGNVVPDAMKRKFDSRRRVDFGVSSTQDVSVFIEATGIQVWTPSGWKIENEEQRGTIWRMKAGTSMEVCVERPESGSWRAFVRCASEMKGWPRLKAQLREAWILRSFSNWSGKAWGGGRFGGSFEIRSEEFEE